MEGAERDQQPPASGTLGTDSTGTHCSLLGLGRQQGIGYKGTFRGTEQPPHARDRWLLLWTLARQGEPAALHGGMVTPLWQQRPDHPHQQQRPKTARPRLTHKILSTTPHFQRCRSCPGLRVPAQLVPWRGSEPPSEGCRSEDTMGHSSAANMCPCDDFGNRNGLNICSRVVSVFVCQAQRDFSSASAQPFILLCCCQLEAALCDPGPRRAG